MTEEHGPDHCFPLQCFPAAFLHQFDLSFSLRTLVYVTRATQCFSLQKAVNQEVSSAGHACLFQQPLTERKRGVSWGFSGAYWRIFITWSHAKRRACFTSCNLTVKVIHLLKELLVTEKQRPPRSNWVISKLTTEFNYFEPFQQFKWIKKKTFSETSTVAAASKQITLNQSPLQVSLFCFFSLLFVFEY